MEQVTLGQWVPIDPTKREERKIRRQIHSQQRRGRMVGFELEDLGAWDTWLSTPLRNPDGTYSALIPLQAGRNVLEVFARSTSGAEDTQRVAVELGDGRLTLSMSGRQSADLARLREIRRQDLAVGARIEGELEITTEPSAADRDRAQNGAPPPQ